jgi:hypothetical protein
VEHHRPDQPGRRRHLPGRNRPRPRHRRRHAAARAGIGAQGGDIEATVKAGRTANATGLMINSSRAILYAGKDEDLPRCPPGGRKPATPSINTAKETAMRMDDHRESDNVEDRRGAAVAVAVRLGGGIGWAASPWPWWPATSSASIR